MVRLMVHMITSEQQEINAGFFITGFCDMNLEGKKPSILFCNVNTDQVGEKSAQCVSIPRYWVFLILTRIDNLSFNYTFIIYVKK